MQLEPLPFSKLMGVNVVSVTPDLVIGELKVREDLCTRPAVLHGGAYMAFADTIGAVATVANLKDGEGTTTIESKTNFLRGHPAGRYGTRRVHAAAQRAAPRWCGKRRSRAAMASSPRL
jgi:1,4-dihydroxy-2-naphthoyl-CoA hydrolase